MDFHQAFYEIDTDHSGEITREELEDYMRKKNYKETFVQKWLSIFDVDNSGTITYEEYCTTLGLVPKEPEPKPTPMEEPVDESVVVAKSQAKVASGRKLSSEGATAGGETSDGARGGGKTSDGATGGGKTSDGARGGGKRSDGAGGAAARKATPGGSPAKTTAARTDGKGACRSADSRNSILSRRHGLLMRFSGARVLQKKALYRIKPATVRGSGSIKKNTSGAKSAGTTVTKSVDGENNGKTRTVPTNRPPRFYPSQETKRRSTAPTSPKRHLPPLRASIQPGAVLILVSGRHRGKRVVFLKRLEDSGLLLVTGPLKLNGCPLRRVNAAHVIATSTRLNLTGLELPERLTDAYFRRASKERRSRGGGDGDIFRKEASGGFQLTSERKDDQQEVDKGVMAAIAASEDGPTMRQYLRQLFSLSRGDRPHAMRF